MRWFALLTLSVLAAVGCAGSNPQERESTGTIAFTRGDHVWLMRDDGSGQRRLTRGADPSWSPDGRKIALSVDRIRYEWASQIWVVDADGHGLRRLTTVERSYDTHSSPVWSPDGKTIAFEGYNDGNYWINVVGVDGSGQRELSQWPYGDVAPVWSRDGRSIMFTNISNDAVYVMRPDGSGRRVVGRVDGEDRNRGLVWSPDRRRFTVLIDADLWLLTAEGRPLVKLFDSPIDKPERWGDIAWAPDGRTIAFSVVEGKGEDAESEIYVVNADGDGLHKLTDDRGHDGGPVWSPDGRAIGFTSERDGNSEIYVMNADGSDQRNVSQSPMDDSSPAWSPTV
jgi:Tol biopolymer transport system component